MTTAARRCALEPRVETSLHALAATDAQAQTLAQLRRMLAEMTSADEYAEAHVVPL